MKGAYILLIVFALCAIGLLVCGILTILDGANKKDNQLTKCYDRYSNEIIGQQCIDQNGKWGTIAAGIMVSIMGIFIFGFVIFFIFPSLKFLFGE